MDEFPDFDDIYSGYPAFFTPSPLVWSDFLDFIDVFKEGDIDLIES